MPTSSSFRVHLSTIFPRFSERLPKCALIGHFLGHFTCRFAGILFIHTHFTLTANRRTSGAKKASPPWWFVGFLRVWANRHSTPLKNQCFLASVFKVQGIRNRPRLRAEGSLPFRFLVWALDGICTARPAVVRCRFRQFHYTEMIENCKLIDRKNEKIKKCRFEWSASARQCPPIIKVSKCNLLRVYCTR